MHLPLTGDEAVDAVLECFPDAQLWLHQHGLICTECGEVVWGTLRELGNNRGLDGTRFSNLLAELNEYLASGH
jgi:hypothetical protein